LTNSGRDELGAADYQVGSPPFVSFPFRIFLGMGIVLVCVLPVGPQGDLLFHELLLQKLGRDSLFHDGELAVLLRKAEQLQTGGIEGVDCVAGT
jgi:hypothetical protein